MNSPTAQDIFLRFYPDYLEEYRPSTRQAATARHIMNCKSGAMALTSVHVKSVAASITITIPVGTGDVRCVRSFLKKDGLTVKRKTCWIHLIPEELNALIYSNQKAMYDLLYQTASETITELSADPEHLGVKVGFLSVLHTWESCMAFHPHLHYDK